MASAPLRGVHFDLKGMPPTFERLLGWIDLCASLGFQFVLMEWEDAFPWTLDAGLRCETAYSADQVQAIHEHCRERGLQVIPLVQSLGHMETPLSLDRFASLREIPYRSSGLNPLAPGARDLVLAMVDEVLAASPGVTHFHLGGDEAWTLGQHPDTAAFVKTHGKAQLYWQHVEPLLDHLLARGVRPILWHDMMSSWEPDLLAKLAAKADLMFWVYERDPLGSTDDHFGKPALDRFQQADVTLWGAGCFRGAGGSDRDLPNGDVLASNALAWTRVASQYDLHGIVATGWARYATHQLQCEPFDGAMDSLARVASILRDSVDSGVDRSIERLSELGERERFIACRDALRELSVARDAGWRWLRSLHQLLVTMADDPRRRSGCVEIEYAKLTRQAIARCERAGEAMAKAFDGMTDPIWVKRYLHERIAPLKEQLATLQERGRSINPDAWDDFARTA
ncbi:MAG: family 20 glycosylhydrolase [Tepidisphaeraceae bacterium]